MAGNSQSIANLQTALAMEMGAVHQYLLHAHTLEDWGLDRLGARMREEMAEERGHLDRFVGRIVFLGGGPEIRLAKSPEPAETLKTLFEADLADEEEAIRFYAESARTAAEEGDIGTQRLFENIVLDEEGHKDWLETQLGLIERIGEANYATRHMGMGGDAGAQQ